MFLILFCHITRPLEKYFGWPSLFFVVYRRSCRRCAEKCARCRLSARWRRNVLTLSEKKFSSGEGAAIRCPNPDFRPIGLPCPPAPSFRFFSLRPDSFRALPDSPDLPNGLRCPLRRLFFRGLPLFRNRLRQVRWNGGPTKKRRAVSSEYGSHLSLLASSPPPVGCRAVPHDRSRAGVRPVTGRTPCGASRRHRASPSRKIRSPAPSRGRCARVSPPFYRDGCRSARRKP